MNNTEECENVGESYNCRCLPGYTGTSCEVNWTVDFENFKHTMDGA